MREGGQVGEGRLVGWGNVPVASCTRASFRGFFKRCAMFGGVGGLLSSFLPSTNLSFINHSYICSLRRSIFLALSAWRKVRADMDLPRCDVL